MQNVEIARRLDDIADLLEIQGANPFRIRAYRNAARTIEDYPTQLHAMVSAGEELTQIPAVGKDIAGYVTELIGTGTCKLLDDLAKTVPLSLIELTRLPGLGAKRVKKLWEELEVETLDALERAAAAGEVEQLDGFGKKSQEKILAAIRARREQTRRFKLSEADQLIEPLLEHLRGDRSVERLEVAGSYRRRRETVGDIDLLAISTEPAPVMERFTGYRDVARVAMSGETRGTVMLRSGLQVDLRILPRESYGAALQYFTGSKEHNVKFRKRAVARGLRVSEYGVFRVEERQGGRRRQEADVAERDVRAGTMVAGREETDVYAALDLPWIPPELREDRGELEAAERGGLPDLLVLEDVRADLQMHSTWSDGKNSIEEMLEGCLARGYDYFAITDHSKALAMTGGLDAAKLRRQWAEIDELLARRHDPIRLLRGMEVDILADGRLDLEDELLAELDLVVASVHSKLDLPAAEQTRRILRALEHPEVNVLGHPTGRLINRREPMAFDLDAVLARAVELGVAVELNAHPDRLDLRDYHVMRARELGAKIVISTDAHRVQDLRLMRYGVDQARRAWCTRADVLNTLPVTQFLKAIERTC